MEYLCTTMSTASLNHIQFSSAVLAWIHPWSWTTDFPLIRAETCKQHKIISQLSSIFPSNFQRKPCSTSEFIRLGNPLLRCSSVGVLLVLHQQTWQSLGAGIFRYTVTTFQLIYVQIFCQKYLQIVTSFFTVGVRLWYLQCDTFIPSQRYV